MGDTIGIGIVDQYFDFWNLVSELVYLCSS